MLASKLWSRLIFITVGVRLVVDCEADRLPSDPFIVVSNHTSNFDIPALFLAFHRTLYFISKKELQKIPFMGWVMTAFGMVFIDRSNPELARKAISDAAKEIRGGKTLMSFPEGTRSRTGSMQSFKKGTFHLAVAAQVPVIPVAITGAASINPPGTWELESGTIHLSIGQPVDSRQFETASELSDAVKAKIEYLLKNKPAEVYAVSAG
jgi:1-acyl-sn-glycerol-3-phosphate acyltransferase